MEISEALKSLLREAYQLSEEAIGEVSKNCYQQITRSPFGNKDFPYIELEQFGNEIFRIMKLKCKMEESCIAGVRRGSANEVLGLQLYFAPGHRGTDAEYSIWINESLNMCWYRFVLLKEICQIYCDRMKDTTRGANSQIAINVDLLLQQMRNLGEAPNLFAIEPTDENYTEFLAFFMAINLICPSYHRATFDSLAADVVNGLAPHTFYDLANLYKMPEYIINCFASQMLPFYKELA